MREERVDCRLMMSQSALLSTSSTKDEFGMDGAMKAHGKHGEELSPADAAVIDDVRSIAITPSTGHTGSNRKVSRQMSGR